MKSLLLRLAALRAATPVGTIRILALALVNGAGAGLLLLLIGQALSQPIDVPLVMFCVLGVMLATAAPLPMPGGGVFSPVFWPTLMLGMISGPAIAAVVGSLFSIELRELRGGVPWYGVLYNRAAIAFDVWAAVVVYQMLAGDSFQPEPRSFLAAGAAAVVFIAVNAPFVAVAYWIRGVRFRQVLTTELLAAGVFVVALAPLSWIAALLYLRVGAWSSIVLLPAVYLAWRGWKQLMTARQVQALLNDAERILAAVAVAAPKLFISTSNRPMSQLLSDMQPAHVSCMRLLRLADSELRTVARSGSVAPSPELERWIAAPDTIDTLRHQGSLEWRGTRPRTSDDRLAADDDIGSALLLAMRSGVVLWGALLVVSREIEHDFHSMERQTLLAAVNVLGSALALEDSRRNERLATGRLRESEQRHRKVIETLAEGVAVIAGDGSFVSHNSSARMMLEPLIGPLPTANARTICELARGEDGVPYASGTCPLEYAMQARRPASAVMTFEQAGRNLTWLVNARPLEDGQAGEIVLSVADLTERRRMEVALLQAQRIESLGRLAGSVAHDQNNILGAVVGYAELALDEVGNGPGSDEIRRLIDAADRGRALTQQLLAFSRGQGLVLRTVDLNRVVEDIQPLLEGMAHAFGSAYRIAIGLDDQPLIVEADVPRIEQVISNLVTNALEAMPTGGTVRIETKRTRIDDAAVARPGRYAQLSVSDTGIGIPDDQSVEVFTPFFTTKAEGTGLGLATVHGIISQLGGAISVDSALGAGTCFSVFLPEGAGADLRPPKPATEHMLSPPPSAALVLVVDDEDDVREISQRMLERGGYRVVCAANAVEAIEIIERTRLRPDLLLTDVIMPGLDGRQLAAHLRRSLPGLRVLFMSGWSDHAEAVDGDRRLDKPFSQPQLMEAVRESLATPLLA